MRAFKGTPRNKTIKHFIEEGRHPTSTLAYSLGLVVGDEIPWRRVYLPTL
jgi:hypothetical protein